MQNSLLKKQNTMRKRVIRKGTVEETTNPHIAYLVLCSHHRN